MSILSQIDAGKTLSQPQLGLAISKMSTYQALGSLQNKGMGPWQGVTGRDVEGVGGARIRAKTMRISINKEAKRRQQRQWVWLQPKQRSRKRSKRKRRGPRQKKQQKTEANGSDGGARAERRRRHHLSNTHTQRSSKVLSLQLSRQAWPRQQRQQQQLFL